ncbi:MAG: DNA primase, partial [Candidatus Kerfeldbacteria bacterium]|nr:DNA primase [Candidatus Kerfeldbacteria bacterium]
ASPSQIDDIKSRINLVEFIGEYVKLTRAGTNYKGLCPFHNEKTPSFMVSLDKQIWHCFGCGEGGDAFGFLMRLEGLSFPDALRTLAERVGVKLRREDPKVASERTGILDALDRAASVYHKILLEAERAEPIRQYLRTRGIDETMWSQFRLGYAPDRRDTLHTVLGKHGISAEMLFQAGLAVKEERGTGSYDRFRGRLMFPIMNVHASVIGFGGRTLHEGENIAKYINTPQTMVYNKSEVLYGIHLARQEMRRRTQAIVVEGYTDCIASHQAGFPQTVAASGTAFTFQQIQLIKRYTTTLLVAFDADLAGETATKRGIVTAIDAGMDVRVVRIPVGKDPAELIQRDAKLWAEAVANAAPFMEYFLAQVFGRNDVRTVAGKKLAAAELLPILARIPDRIEQTHYLQQVGRRIGVNEDILRESLPSGRSEARPTTAESVPNARGSAIPMERAERLGQRYLALFLSRPVPELVAQIPPEYLPEGHARLLYSLMQAAYNQNHEFDAGIFRAQLQAADEHADLLRLLDVLELLRDDEFTGLEPEAQEREFALVVRSLRREGIQRQLRTIQERIRQLEADATDPSSALSGTSDPSATSSPRVELGVETGSSDGSLETLTRDFSTLVAELQSLDEDQS